MVCRAVARRFQSNPHITALSFRRFYRQVFDEITFFEDVCIGVRNLSYFRKVLVVIGHFHDEAAGFVHAHSVVGDATYSTLLDVRRLLQVYCQREVFA